MKICSPVIHSQIYTIWYEMIKTPKALNNANFWSFFYVNRINVQNIWLKHLTIYTIFTALLL